MDKSKFNLGYLIKGEGAKDWFKAWGNGIRIIFSIALVVLLIAGAYGIYRFFFPKKLAQTQNIVVESGGQATIIQKSDGSSWEIGIFAAGLEYDNKLGGLVGGQIKRRW